MYLQNHPWSFRRKQHT